MPANETFRKADISCITMQVSMQAYSNKDH